MSDRRKKFDFKLAFFTLGAVFFIGWLLLDARGNAGELTYSDILRLNLVPLAIVVMLLTYQIEEGFSWTGATLLVLPTAVHWHLIREITNFWEPLPGAGLPGQEGLALVAFLDFLLLFSWIQLVPFCSRQSWIANLPARYRRQWIWVFVLGVLLLLATGLRFFQIIPTNAGTLIGIIKYWPVFMAPFFLNIALLKLISTRERGVRPENQLAVNHATRLDSSGP